MPVSANREGERVAWAEGNRELEFVTGMAKVALTPRYQGFGRLESDMDWD